METKKRGPVFPSFSGTTGYHMLCETTAPACSGLDGKFHRIAIPLDLKNGAQHNPTVWLAPDGLRVIIRVLHGMKTTNYAARVNDAWLLEEATVVRQAPYDAQIEDLRVFNRPDGLWAIAAVHDGRQPPVSIRQAILALDDDGGAITRVHVQPSNRHEKNWMPCVMPDGSVRVVYSTEPLIVLDMDLAFNEVRTLPRADAIPHINGYVRGGSQLIPWKDGYLAIVHRVYRRLAVPENFNPLLSGFWAAPSPGPAVTYQHHFAFFDHWLEKVTVGAPWHFRGPGVEFCNGLARVGDHWVAAFGVADKEAWLVEFGDDVVTASIAQPA